MTATNLLCPGIVYVVGAGPGDPRLITVGGLEAVRGSDALVYDRLVSPALLREAPVWAERIPVGKRPWGVAVTPDGRYVGMSLTPARSAARGT